MLAAVLLFGRRSLERGAELRGDPFPVGEARVGQDVPHPLDHLGVAAEEDVRHVGKLDGDRESFRGSLAEVDHDRVGRIGSDRRGVCLDLDLFSKRPQPLDRLGSVR
jgi:hypothetical protein